MRIAPSIIKLLKEENAQGLVEYILIITLVAVALMGALATFKSFVENSLQDSTNKL